MASIQKIEGKQGISYKITVTRGRDSTGKQIRHFKTYTPAQGMSERQTEKEVQRIAYEFEQLLEQGYAVDNRQTFAGYAAYVLELKERQGLKQRTLSSYRSLLERINPAIGHLKLIDIRPQHLNAFYKNLAEKGIRKGAERATAKKSIKALVKRSGMSYADFCQKIGIALMTLNTAEKRQSIRLTKAQAMADGLNIPLKDLFYIKTELTPLSPKTIIEYHRLISTILHQADKEMLVLFNAAQKATPPKVRYTEAETFQPEDIEKIMECLEDEPLRLKVIIHLLIITGCRRGELAGLKWSKIDWDNNQIKIDTTRLYTPESGAYESTTKTHNSRFIKVPQVTMDLLNEYKAEQERKRVLYGSAWMQSEFVIVRENGQPIHPDSISLWVSEFGKRHGIPRVHPHKFRHTMASLLYFGGMDSITISKRLGHAKVSTTTDIYSHIIKQADEAAGECIADAILPAKKTNSQTAG